MSESSYTDELESRLTVDDIERARIRLYGEFPPLEPIEPSRRDLSFIEERRFLRKQITQVFRIPSSVFEETRLLSWGPTPTGRQEARIESKIRLKVIGQ